MKYVNARNILPEALVRELQGYIRGGYVYVPVEGARRHWGELSGYRKELEQRNREIVRARGRGASLEALAEEYCLSVHAIKKILYTK